MKVRLEIYELIQALQAAFLVLCLKFIISLVDKGQVGLHLLGKPHFRGYTDVDHVGVLIQQADLVLSRELMLVYHLVHALECVLEVSQVLKPCVVGGEGVQLISLGIKLLLQFFRLPFVVGYLIL